MSNTGKSKSKAKLYNFKTKFVVAEYFNNEEKDDIIMEHREKGRKIARSILRRWNCKLNLEEVDSVVDLSLCEAVRKFNPNKGVTFVTFLFYYLRGNLIRTVDGLANASSTPVDIRDEFLEEGKIGNATINTADVFELLGGNSSKLLGEKYMAKEFFEIATKACEVLSPIEREVIENIFIQESQVTELAKKLKYSRCHLSRVKTEAVRKLRKEVGDIIGEEIVVEEKKKAPARKLKSSKRKLSTKSKAKSKVKKVA